MSEQLLLSKRLFLVGSDYADRDDPVFAGLAISIFQDAIEIFIWSLVKFLDAQPKENATFTSYFDLVANATNNPGNKRLPLRAKMLELNKARVNFKHYGNLPDCSEARKFRAYTEEFLILSFNEFYSVDFDSVSIVDLVGFIDIRDRLKAAELQHSNENYKDSLRETAIAKSLLFSKVGHFFPKMDRRLSDADRVFQGLPSARGFNAFAIILKYLDASREASLVAMLGIPLSDYILMQKNFPGVVQTMSGDWHTTYWGTEGHNETTSKNAIQMIATIAMRAQELIGKGEPQS